MAGSPNIFARSALSIAIVDGGVYYTGADGRLYVNIPAQPFEGGPGVWSGVPVLGFGGTADRFANFGRPTAQPALPELPSRLALLFVGTSNRPWAAFDTYAAAALVTETAETAHNADRTQDVSPSDHAMKNGGGAVILDSYGRIALIAGNNPDISAQLGEGGIFRVSRAGNGTGVPVLKSPWVSFEQDLRTQLNVMLARLAVVEAICGVTNPPAVTFPNPANAAVGAAAVRVPSTAE